MISIDLINSKTKCSVGLIADYITVIDGRIIIHSSEYGNYYDNLSDFDEIRIVNLERTRNDIQNKRK